MTNNLSFAPATKAKAKARIGFAGVSGSGKTYTALEWATVLADGDGSQIGLIDTERDSASLYADNFAFQTLPMSRPYHPDRLIEAMRIAEEAGIEVLVIDSLSHFWNGAGGILEIVDAAKSKFGGNSHMAWAVGTPLQQKLVDALLAYPGHVIVTMRTKSEWLEGQDSRGKKTMQKIGTTPQQRDGIEYEFTLMLDVDLEHRSMVGKTRCSDIAGHVYGPSDAADAAKAFKAWLESGVEIARQDLTPAEQAEVMERIAALPAAAKNAMREQWTAQGLPGPADLRLAHLEAARGLLAAAEAEMEGVAAGNAPTAADGGAEAAEVPAA